MDWIQEVNDVLHPLAVLHLLTLGGTFPQRLPEHIAFHADQATGHEAGCAELGAAPRLAPERPKDRVR